MSEIFLFVLLGSTFILSIYWTVAWIKISRYSTNTSSQNQPVSVIVCAHNELDNLKELIPILQQQNHPNFEIIIVDDRSDDDTFDYMLDIKSEKLKHVRVDKVHDHINAKKYAITLGVKAAKNDILLFTDADCRPTSENWITEMTSHIQEQTKFSLGVSQYIKEKGFLNLYIRYETQQTAVNYAAWALAGNPYMGVGRNLAYRKSAFIENKGFNKFQHIMGGDDDLLVNQLANKKNTQVVLGADSLTLSVPKKTWREYFRQKLRHFSVSKYYSFKDKTLLGLQNLSNLLFWLSLIILAIQTNRYEIVLGILLFRWIMLMNLNYFTSKKFGDRINTWLVPVLDLFYVLFVTTAGTIAIFTKKVKWK
ncbi:glycosyltransferase [Reichenbachiella agarivorans]|uniref:Glycosyltransferase n=1 Tax=Reichenbachiella agarivorans TaxID=2979464 RepID=A0ABY6CK07_9BACT|nr:glycosyltransferase [Reichenbachiella agarivorans]UXP30724.1 glycosyltransferase [Reichenbachiella agarivorans]